MKTLNTIILSLILLSPLSMGANTANDNELSRDSINAVIQAAEAGDPVALNTVGLWYYNGEYIHQNYENAVKCFTKAASLNNNDAVGNLGMCYQYGNGITGDDAKALKLYERSLRKGNQALFNRLKAEADSGNLFSCNAMGKFYYYGISVQRNYATAAKYYEIPAAKGNVNAQMMAGLSYLNSKDYKQAAKWFKKGATAGNATSQYFYGKLLCEGQGVNTDPEMGFVYVLKAAEAGNANAQYYVSGLYKSGTGVAASKAQSDIWLGKAAHQGLSKAIFDYAVVVALKDDFIEASYLFSWLQQRNAYTKQIKALFTEGDSTSILSTPFGQYTLALKYMEANDFKAAEEQIKLLAKGKYVIADILSALVKIDPDNTKGNFDKGLKALAKLAETDGYAAYILGEMYMRGNENLIATPATAVGLFTKALEKDFAFAACALGDCAYEGLNGEKNVKEAAECYSVAYAAGNMLAAPASRYATLLSEDSENDEATDLAADIKNAKYPTSITAFTTLLSE